MRWLQVNIQTRKHLLKQEAVTGITTGQLLCACVGSKARSEYTVYGDAINLSARLMMKAKQGLGSVLCDFTTHELAYQSARFTKLEPIQVCCLCHMYKCFMKGYLTSAHRAAIILKLEAWLAVYS